MCLTFVLCQHVGLEQIEELVDSTSPSLDEEIVSTRVGLHVLSLDASTRIVHNSQQMKHFISSYQAADTSFGGVEHH